MFLIIKKTLRGEVQVIKLERTDTTFDQSRSRETMLGEPILITITPTTFHLYEFSRPNLKFQGQCLCGPFF